MDFQNHLTRAIAVSIVICLTTGCAWLGKDQSEVDLREEPSWDYAEMSDDRFERREQERDDFAPFDFLKNGTKGSGVTAEGREIERRLGYR